MNAFREGVEGCHFTACVQSQTIRTFSPNLVIPACKVHITGAAILINAITKGVDKFRRFDYSNRAQLAIIGVLSQICAFYSSAKSYNIPILRRADFSTT
jgi:hypothetical protein